MSARVTSFDVAKLAGVSQPTVSRVMRGSAAVTAQTSAKVRMAADQLGYVTSDRGRTLSTRTTRRVAIVSDQLTNPFYPELLEPVRLELDKRGYRSVLVADHEEDAPDDLINGSYDGVVLTTTRRDSPLPGQLRARGIPHVLMNRVIDGIAASSVTVDNADGMRQVTALITSLGHRVIGAIHGPTQTSTGKERKDALASSLHERGLHIPARFEAYCEFDHDAALNAARRLLSVSPRPSALVCANDVIALGALSAARELGIAVPRELTVIGFDDIRMASWPLIALTTVRVDLAALAEVGVQAVLAAMNDNGLPTSSVSLPVSLVQRGTHAGPSPATFERTATFTN